MYLIPLFDFGCLTLISALGVLADMHNQYLSFCFLARNILLVWLIRSSELAKLLGKLANLMCGAVVSRFLAHSYCKDADSWRRGVLGCDFT